MKTGSFLVCTILLAITSKSFELSVKGKEVPFPTKDHVDLAKSITRANLNFSLDVLKKLSGNKENVAFSPFGITSGLGIVSLASQQKTLEEIEKALYLSEISHQNSTDEVKAVIKDVIGNMKRNKGRDGSFASAIFIHSGCGISPTFGRQAIDIFHSDIQQLDFTFKSAAVDTINRWVSKETNKKITAIVSEDSLSPDTKLMLVNAVHFKGEWEQPFNLSSTEDKDFTLLNKNKVKVKMMKRSGEYQHGFDKDTTTKVLVLPYKDSKLRMAILLPKENDGLPQLIQNLTPDVIKRMISNLTEVQLSVELPRFKLDTEYQLNNILGQLGISDLFSPKADISGIFCNQTLYVNQMLHKTSLEVDESGTTAASITAMDLIPLNKPFEFIVDHPFLYFIYDHESEVVLFIGAMFKFP